MNIRINETNHVGFDDSVLMDIGRFQDLPSWLVAIKNNTVAFRPLDCAVIDNQRILWVVKAGQLAEDIDATIEKVRRLPAHYCNFPNDHTEYSKEFGGTRSDGQPFTGNGYTGSAEHVIPEYVSNGTTPSSGEIYRVNPDGTEEAVAYYDPKEKVFSLYD